MKKILVIAIAVVMLVTASSAYVFAGSTGNGLGNGAQIQLLAKNNPGDNALLEQLRVQLKLDHKDKEKRMGLMKKIVALLKAKGDKSIPVFINGEEPKFDAPAVIKSGRTLVPLRGLANSLGATVMWNPTTRTITIKKTVYNDAGVGIFTTIIFKIDSLTITSNGNPVVMDYPAILISNRTFVPIRFLAELLGKKVNWEKEDGIVIIEDVVAPAIIGAKTFDTNADGNVDSVQFQFSEAIDDSTYVANTFTFSDDNFVSNDAGAAITTSRIDGTVDADADDEYIVATFAPVNALGTGVMNYRFLNVTGIDMSGNIAIQVAAAAGVAAVDLAKPVYMSINSAAAGGPATLTFSEAVTVPGIAGLVLTTDITGTVNAVAITAIAIAQDLTATATLVTGAFAPVGIDLDDLVVTLTAAGAGKIQDAAGNTVDTTVLTRTDTDISD